MARIKIIGSEYVVGIRDTNGIVHYSKVDEQELYGLLDELKFFLESDEEEDDD